MSVREQKGTAPEGSAAGGLDRRRFLLATGGAVALGLAGGLGVLVATDRRPLLDAATGNGVLDEVEMRAMHALVEVLISPAFRPLPPQVEAVLTAAMRRTPGLAAAYRDGLQLLDELMRKRARLRFADAPQPQRNALLESVCWRYDAEGEDGVAAMRIRLVRRAERAVLSPRERAFRELVMRDVLIRLHARTAWRITGFPNHPGMPGDPRAYVDAPKLLPRPRPGA